MLFMAVHNCTAFFCVSYFMSACYIRTMKLLTLIIIILLTMALTVSGKDNSGAVTVAAGLSVPVSPSTVKQEYSIGPNIGFGLGYKVARILELEPRLYFSSFPHEDNESLKLFEIGTDLKFFTREPRPNRLSSYFICGISMSYMSYSNGEQLWGDSFDRDSKTGTETNFGFNLGVGIDHPIRPGYGFFVDIRYTIDFGEYDVLTYIPFRIGFKFTSGKLKTRP